MQTVRPSQFQIFLSLNTGFATALGFLLLFGLISTSSAQSANQLSLTNNYFVTGDYVVGGVGLRGLGDASGFAKGTISIPDPAQPNSFSVPPGADIVAAFLYWETVEGNQGSFAGQNGFFNGYAITGTIRGNPNAPTSWSTGGCSGSSQGSKTMRVYRADVRPYLNLDANGNLVGNGTYAVQLRDSGSNGGGVPLTLGASLVVIYRVQSPQVPLNSIVLYDGAFAPSNSSSTMTLPIVGFYEAGSLQPGQAPVSKITHIVGNGQPNKLESVSLNSVNLTSLYTGFPPFPGVYNQNTFSPSGGGSWDNPTWTSTTAVPAEAASATAQVVPSGSNSGCVNWGAVVFSTTVQSSDNDGLLDVWKKNQGYIDANAPGTQWVTLPGAVHGQKDLFVELDYLSNLDGSAGAYLHSHLPKKDALDRVGDAFLRAGVHVHFDLGVNANGKNVYPSDPYIVSYPVPAPPKGSGATTFPNAGGNSISEGLFVCSDTAALCPFPGVAQVGWKGDVEFAQSQTTLGSFQPGRKDSYHYVLFGHALGSPSTYWAAAGAAQNFSSSGVATLVSINVSNHVGTVNLSSPPLVLRPGDAACTANCDRVTIEGALQASNSGLNGTFSFSSPTSSNDNTTPSTTSITVSMPNVADGTYSFSNEPQLGLTFGGPTSDSGFSDIGGGDSAVTFGLWPADDVPGCQPDPSKAVNPPQVYCTNQVGTTTAQAGTLLHELGHTLFLTHGGTFFPDGAVTLGQQTNNPLGTQNYGLNCNPAYLSSMNYLFQIRGFPDGGVDYSQQTLAQQNFSGLSETSLNEQIGIGSDLYTGQLAPHFTRWYALPNALDTQLQNATGGRFAKAHCDGTPIAPGEPIEVRVDGTTLSAPIDWNNDLVVPNLTEPVGWQDVNFNGSTIGSPDPPPNGFNDMQGFNDKINLDLRQISARVNAFGLSGGPGQRTAGGGQRTGGGGQRTAGGGQRTAGGGQRTAGGGSEQDSDIANSTADAPAGVNCSDCVVIAGVLTEKNKVVKLSWTSPEFGQVRMYSVWRAVGTFPTMASIVANPKAFTIVGTVGKLTDPTPPAASFTDSTVKNNTTYTYFVTNTNKQGVQSAASNPPRVVAVKF